MFFDRQKAVEFARNWASYTFDPKTRDLYESTPGFPLPAGKNDKSRSNDCTNFVSQCLYAGGWTMAAKVNVPQNPWTLAKIGILPPNIRDRNNWFYKSGSFSFTWKIAPELAYFIHNSQRGYLLFFDKLTSENKRQLMPGDVFFIASEKDNIESIWHVALVTKGGEQFEIHQHGGSPTRDSVFFTSHETTSFFSVWRLLDSFSK